MKYLTYDPLKWEEVIVPPLNTLQLFITNRCDLSCHDCFYKSRLGQGDMSFDDYKRHIEDHFDLIKKVVLLGGEPTLHPDIPSMIGYNNHLGLKTTVYTNGNNLNMFTSIDLSQTSIRVSVYGTNSKEKSIKNLLCKPHLPLVLVYMLNRDNISELLPAVKIAEGMGFKKVFISSIRDIARSGDYWKETNKTLPLIDYAHVIQNFVDTYSGNLELHMSRRGVLRTIRLGEIFVNECRFGNIFPNGDKIICPFDICKNIKTAKLTFNQRKCNKNPECLLRKIVLKRINIKKPAI